MINLRIEGCTRVCGKAQGYIGLHIRDEVIDGRPVMATAWEPTPGQLAILNAGGKIVLRLGGTIPPPMKIDAES